MSRKKGGQSVTENANEAADGGCGCLVAIFLVLAFFLGLAYLNHSNREKQEQREHELKMEELRHI